MGVGERTVSSNILKVFGDDELDLFCVTFAVSTRSNKWGYREAELDSVWKITPPELILFKIVIASVGN